MRRAMLVLGGLGAIGFLTLWASPAHATLTGPCTGSAVVTDPKGEVAPVTINATGTGPYEVPLKGSAQYEGAVTGVQASAGQKLAFAGKVFLKLPAPLPDIEVVSWSGESEKTSDSGVYDYDLPSFVPRGVDIPLHAEHKHEGQALCTADVTVRIHGSAIGPFSLATGLAAAGTGAGFVYLGARPFIKARGAKR